MDDGLPPGLRDTLGRGLAGLGLDPALATPLLDYLALLDRWNRTYNLTAIRDPRGMVALHLLDSLALVPHMDGIATLADLGTGAGLPGIPLAIALPALRVTLVESSGRKRASCARPCAGSGWATPASPNRAPRRWTSPAPTTPSPRARWPRCRRSSRSAATCSRPAAACWR
jgi:hypothetical protein